MMKANLDRLTDGAVTAAESILSVVNNASPELAILISCFGRRSILKQRTEEEVEAVSDVCGSGCMLTGFYSYVNYPIPCFAVKAELHNKPRESTQHWQRF